MWCGVEGAVFRCVWKGGGCAPLGAANDKQMVVMVGWGGGGGGGAYAICSRPIEDARSTQGPVSLDRQLPTAGARPVAVGRIRPC
jgi:hypothetical protein